MIDQTRKDPPKAEQLAETHLDGSQPLDETLPPDQQKQAVSLGALPEEFGRYRIKKELGRGGMGLVYLALDTQLDREVALKVPKFGPEDGPEEVKRFYREARAMATVFHPNLCPVYDVGEIDGRHYITMAFIDGHTLSTYLKRGKALKERQAAALIRKLAIALQRAHDQQIVHRDLKPDNIMINSDKEPIIMDFGLARRKRENETQLTQAGAIMGTPAYMSPEQVEGEQDNIGPQTDVYALGVILYQMLSGKLPFEGSLASVLAKIAVQEPSPPSRVNRKLSPELEAICLKAMSKKLTNRYLSAGELADELSRFLKGELTQSEDDELNEPEAVDPHKQETFTGTDRLVADLFADLAVHEKAPTPTSLPKIEPTGKQLAGRTKVSAPTTRTKKKKSPWFSNPKVLIGGGAGLVLLLALVIVLSNSGSNNDPSGGNPVVRKDKSKDSTAKDQSKDGAQNDNGKRGNPSVLPLSIGGANYALEFDGQGSWVETLVKYDGSHPITLEATVIPYSENNGNVISNGVTNAGMALQQSTHDPALNPEERFAKWAVVSQFRRQPRDGNKAFGTSKVAVGEPTSLAAVVWLHPTNRKKKPQIQIYVNGKLEVSHSIVGRDHEASKLTFVLGADGSHKLGYFFHGIIDEVRISSIARYDKNFTPAKRFKPDEHTLALYHFDEGDGDVLKDSSGNNHHGTIVGAKWVRVDDN